MTTVADDVGKYIQTENSELTRFLTLTLPGKGLEAGDTFDEQKGQFRHMVDEVVGKIEHRKDQPIEYVGGIEPQQNGNPHAHLLVDCYIDQYWLANAWRDCGDRQDRGGYIHIKQVDDAEAAADYLVGYVGGEVVGNIF